MSTSRLACLALLLLAACGGSSAPPPVPPVPDLTAPRIANPLNVGLGRRAVLQVRFTEPVFATGASEVVVRSGTVADLPAVVTLTADGILEVAALDGFPVPDTVEVTVRYLADAAGNVLVQESATFETTGWLDSGLDPGPVDGPNGGRRPELVRAGGVTQLVWPHGRAFRTDADWLDVGANFFEQALAADGGSILRLISGFDGLSLEGLAAGEATSLPGNQPAAGPQATSLDGCGTGSSRAALAAWLQTGVSAPWDVRAARWEDGTWTDLGAVSAEAGATTRPPAAACSTLGTAFVAFEQDPCDGAACVRVLQRARGEAGWSEILRLPRSRSPALAAIVDLPVVASWRSTGSGSALQVSRRGVDGWESLGDLNVDPQSAAVEPSLVLEPGGRIVVAWNEYDGGVEASRVFVKAWDGTAWSLLGGGPVNDEAPFLAAWTPRVAVGEDGVVEVAYLEWDGTGAVMDVGRKNFRLRTKRLVP